MNTLILYATKYGATHEIAERISKGLDGADLHDLKQGDTPALSGYGCIIIGSSLYAGAIRKEAKLFFAKNGDKLRGKKVGLFLSGMAKHDEKKYAEDNFPSDILQGLP